MQDFVYVYIDKKGISIAKASFFDNRPPCKKKAIKL